VPASILASQQPAFRGGGFSPASLFAASEPGVWFDPSDLTTMFQDSTGTAPVTASGQPVGLVFDKRIGTRTQSFSDAGVSFAGTSGYAQRLVAGVYTFARDAGGSGTVLIGGLVIGKAYLVSLRAGAYTGPIGGSFAIRADILSMANAALRPAIIAAGVYTFFFVAAATSFQIRSGSVGGAATISEVSVLDIPGNHAIQATAASRPAYQVDGTGRGYLSFDGVDDSIQTNNVSPEIDRAQLFTGIRKNSDATIAVVCELGSNSSAVDGSFALFAPVNPGVAQYVMRSRGTLTGQRQQSGFPAGVNHVLYGFSDIAAPDLGFRVNRGNIFRTDQTQGTGNYLTHAIFIGRRAGASLPFNGRIYGLLLRFGPNLNDAQITAAETWMNQKTGAY